MKFRTINQCMCVHLTLTPRRSSRFIQNIFWIWQNLSSFVKHVELGRNSSLNFKKVSGNMVGGPPQADFDPKLGLLTVNFRCHGNILIFFQKCHMNNHIKLYLCCNFFRHNSTGDQEASDQKRPKICFPK